MWKCHSGLCTFRWVIIYRKRNILFRQVKWYISYEIWYTAKAVWYISTSWKYDIRTRPADEIKDFERVPRNLVIRFAHNNIRSFICRRHISSTEGGHHIEDISPVRVKERISLKKVTFVNRQRWLFSWWPGRDSNPCYRRERAVS